MNPVLKTMILVMLMRAGEQFVDYLSARMRSAGGYVYELAILPPEVAEERTREGSWVTRTWIESEPAQEGSTPTRWAIAPEFYPSRVTLNSPASAGELIEVCGYLFGIDTIIHAEGRCDRLLLAPISLDTIPLGRPTTSRFARAWAWLSGYVDGLIGGKS